MKGLIAKRERIVRARRVQHLLATVESARAQNEAMALEQNAQRVRMVRDELFEVGAITSGAALASHRELAGRLEQAGRHLDGARSEEHTSELQSLMRISYAVFCLKKKKTHNTQR